MADLQTINRKERRITVRITETELAVLKDEARRRRTSVGAALRVLIHELLKKR
jgi:hypothetical protein